MKTIKELKEMKISFYHNDIVKNISDFGVEYYTAEEGFETQEEAERQFKFLDSYNDKIEMWFEKYEDGEYYSEYIKSNYDF